MLSKKKKAKQNYVQIFQELEENIEKINFAVISRMLDPSRLTAA